jgi:hypothetical protein
MAPTATDSLRVGSAFDVAPILTGMAQAVDSVEAGTARMNTRFNRVGTESQAAMNKVAFSSTEARHALHGLGEEMGVHVPRFVQTFVAHMGGIGPLLASAFSAIAVVGLIQVLLEVPEAIDKIIGKFTGWDKEAQKTYQDLIQGNRNLQIENLKLEDQMAAIALISRTGSDRASLEMDLLGQSTKRTAELLASFMRARVQMEADLEEKTKPKLGGWDFIGQHILNFFNKGEIDQKKQSIEGLSKSIDELFKTLHEAPVKQAEKSAENVEALKKEAEEYRDLLDRMNSDETKLTQETATKELREFEHLAAERARLDEEISKSSLDMAKKDLAEFERVMIDKAHIQEDQGRYELERIHSQYEQKSRMIEAQNTEKGGDQLSAAAFKALEQETTIIAKMIAQEEELRQKLIAVGNAETDPKIQESLKRQQQLVQQGNVAWQKYQSVVTQVNIDQVKQFRHTFDTISAELNRNLISWMNHTESFGRAMMHVWDNLATTAINSLLRIGEQELIAMVLHKSIADAQKLDDAKAAARGAFKWVMETIPFPLDLVLAPAAAATAFAGVMAFEQGGIVPKGGLAMLHPQEMVLPAPIAQHVMSSAGAGHSGSLTVNFHGHQNLAGMEDKIVAVIKRAQRRGRVTAP